MAAIVEPAAQLSQLREREYLLWWIPWPVPKGRLTHEHLAHEHLDSYEPTPAVLVALFALQIVTREACGKSTGAQLRNCGLPSAPGQPEQDFPREAINSFP
ncbi:MAG TPA: hypothetical protein VGM27_26605 [Acidobacteriaceae bacterium]